MGKSVAVSPAGIMMIGHITGDNFFHELREVLHQAGFILDGRQAACGTRNKEIDDSVLKLVFSKLFRNIPSEVLHVAKTPC